jgi:hypothetical protein
MLKRTPQSAPEAEREASLQADLAELARQMEATARSAEVDEAAVRGQLAHVLRFLRRRAINADALYRLAAALDDRSLGAVPGAMFEPSKRGGRKRLSPWVHLWRGMLAGVAFALRWSASPPDDPEKWVATRSRGMASRISTKSITARMVRKWLDEYGCARKAKTPEEWLDLTRDITNVRAMIVMSGRAMSGQAVVGRAGFIHIVRFCCRGVISDEQFCLEVVLKKVVEPNVVRFFPVLSRT